MHVSRKKFRDWRASSSVIGTFRDFLLQSIFYSLKEYLHPLLPNLLKFKINYCKNYQILKELLNMKFKSQICYSEKFQVKQGIKAKY